MRRQILGRTGLEMSRLGFGCVQLTAQRNRRDAIGILEHAFAAGITHFDTARAYGSGQSEAILGEFLRGKRDRVTVTTKFGLQPPSGLAGNRWVINTAKKILRPFPGLLRGAKKSSEGLGKTSVFNPEAAIQSLETSLRELKTDYVDVLLLHEATLIDATNEALLKTLQDFMTQGRVRCVGIGSDFAKLEGDASRLPAIFSAAQFNDNAAARNVERFANAEELGLITHSVFQPVVRLSEAMAARPDALQSASSKMELNLSDPSVLGSLLLRYALRSNAEGVVLFSSTNPARVTANVKVADTEVYDDTQMRQFENFIDEILRPNALMGEPVP